MKKEIIQALNWRYATNVFDTNKKVSDEDLHTILESARLSPSSFGAEMWKFLVVENKEIREKLRIAGYNQAKITEASHLVVLTCRTDAVENLSKEKIERTAKIQNQKIEDLAGFKNMLDGTVKMKIENNTMEEWLKAQTYIPLGIMMETASLLGIDSCPLEGFQPTQVDEILNLKEKNLKSITMLVLGYRGVDSSSTRPKVRRDFDDVVEFIK
jgi:nitroreductase